MKGVVAGGSGAERAVFDGHQCGESSVRAVPKAVKKTALSLCEFAMKRVKLHQL
jgi:hypothetical protein